MESVLVKELIKITVSGKENKEVPITTAVSESLKKGKKSILCQSEVPYKSLLPGYKANKRIDLVCFHNGEMEVLEFKLFDQKIININFTAVNAIRVIRKDIDKLDELHFQREKKKYPVGLATLTFVCAVFNSNCSGKSTYKESLLSLIEELEENGFEVETLTKKNIFFLIASY
jgi:hypothetical protein